MFFVFCFTQKALVMMEMLSFTYIFLLSSQRETLLYSQLRVSCFSLYLDVYVRDWHFSFYGHLFLLSFWLKYNMESGLFNMVEME